MNSEIRCIVVDDRPAIRLALKVTLQQENISVIAEAGDGTEALRLIKELSPDIVLLDIKIPKLDGLAVLEQVRHLSLPTRFIALSGTENAHLAARVRAAGGSGYIPKSESLELLPTVVKIVNSGYTYFTDTALDMSEKLNDKNALSALSERELAVFHRLAKGEGNSHIAEMLNLSPKTVSTYKSRIFDKLKITNIAELIEVAQREKI